MANKFTSRYPKIIVDKNPNSVNEQLQKKLTIEEFYDLMHHTHSLSDFPVDEGNITYKEMQTKVTELETTVNDLVAIIEADKEIIKQLTENITSIKAELDNVAQVSDWDAIKPGVQDVDGNDLGTIMGFDVTELA